MKSKFINYNKIKPTIPGKIRGKLIKYKTGDCLSIYCRDEKYLGVFISEKFNKFYDLTFIEYLDKRKPTLEDFVTGKFFGCYVEDDNKVYPALHKNMMPCIEVDTNQDIERIGSLELMEPLAKSSYGYDKDIAELLKYYLEDLPQRQINTLNFDRLPNKLFISNRLIEMKKIVKEQQPLTDALALAGPGNEQWL